MKQSAASNIVRGTVGTALVVVGLVLTAMSFEYIEPVPIVDYWPMILVVLGVLAMTNPRPHKPLEGYWLLVFGLWLQACVLHLVGFTYGNSWPVLVIAWGVSLLLRERRQEVAQPQIGHQAQS